MKPWYLSKLVWQNVFLTLMGALISVAAFVAANPVITVAGVLTTVAGVIGIILRVWFTDVPVDTPKAAAKIAESNLPVTRPG